MRTKDRSVFVSAVVVATLATMVLAAYKAHNPHDNAEHHYSRNNKIVYWTIRLCSAGLAAAALFNGRFVITKLSHELLMRFRAHLPDVVKRSMGLGQKVGR